MEKTKNEKKQREETTPKTKSVQDQKISFLWIYR